MCVNCITCNEKLGIGIKCGQEASHVQWPTENLLITNVKKKKKMDRLGAQQIAQKNHTRTFLVRPINRYSTQIT